VDNLRQRLRPIAIILLYHFVGLLIAQDEGTYLMPEWFWVTPEKEGSLFAVGYARCYYTIQTSYDEAFQDAAWRLFINTESRVVGERGMTRTPRGMFSAGSTMKFVVDSTRFDTFAGTLVRIDSATTDELVVMLLGTNKLSLKRRPKPSPAIPQPSDFERNGFMVLVGSSTRYRYEASSWKDAERNARVEAAVTLNLKIRSIEAHASEQDMQTVVLETDAVIRNLQTVARAIDPVTGERIVLVRVKKP